VCFIPRRTALTRQNLNADDFARFTLGQHFEWTATDFAIRDEPLARNARVHGRFKSLAAERALDACEFFHPGNLAACGQSATLLSDSLRADQF